MHTFSAEFKSDLSFFLQAKTFSAIHNFSFFVQC